MDLLVMIETFVCDLDVSDLAAFPIYGILGILIDVLNEQNTGFRYPDGLTPEQALIPFKRRLGQAEVYVLDRDASRMAAHVALAKPTSIAAALPFVRLPFPRTWIEFTNDDLDKAMAEFGSPQDGAPSTVTVKRSGFLLSRDDSSIVFEYAHLDQSEDGRSLADVAPVLCRFDAGPGRNPEVLPPLDLDYRNATGRVREQLRVISSDPEETAAIYNLYNRFSWAPHEDHARTKANLIRMMGTNRAAQIERDEARSAHRLFALQILPALILLNCRNAVDTVAVDASERLNRRRVAGGRPPLVQHRLVKLHLTAARRRIIASSRDAGRVARGTLVRGHFKVRQTGIYWWSPHTRTGYGAVVRRTIVTE